MKLVALVLKNPLANTGDIRDVGSIPGSGRSPGGGNGIALHYSCLRNPWTEQLDGWQSMGSQSQTELKWISVVTNIFICNKIMVKKKVSLVQFSSVAQLCPTLCNPWTTVCQAFLSITNSLSSPKPLSIESVVSSNHLILCDPLLLLPSIFPSIRAFLMSRLFASGDFPGGFPGGFPDDKASTYNEGNPGSIPGLGRSSWEANGNPLQYSCLENPMDGGAW